MFATGRPRSSPNLVTTSMLVGRERVVPKLALGGSNEIVKVPFASDGCQPVCPASSAVSLGPGIPKVETLTVGYASGHRNDSLRLVEVALGRSGDKGDSVNVAIIARHAKFYPYILEQITPQAIQLAIGHHLLTQRSTITRYEVPGVNAVNFVVTKCLGGGGLESLSLDR